LRQLVQHQLTGTYDQKKLTGTYIEDEIR